MSDNGIVSNVIGGLQNLERVAKVPVGAVNAVLGAPQRFVQAEVADKGDIGQGIYGFFHPGDQETQEEQLGKIEGWLGLHNLNPAEKIAADLLVTTFTDPTMLIPGGALLKLTKIPKAAAAIEKVVGMLDKNKLAQFVKLMPKEQVEAQFGKMEGLLSKVPLVKDIKDAYRAALFTINTPHKVNIGRLAMGAPGSKGIGTFIRGAGYAKHGVPKELEEKLAPIENARPSPYMTGPTTPIEQKIGDKFGNKPIIGPIVRGIGKIRDKGQRGLTNWEIGQRAAVGEDWLKYAAKHGGELPGDAFRLKPPAKPNLFEQSPETAFNHRFNEDLGKAFGNMERDSSGLIEYMKARGAPFAPWRMGVVPQAVARSIAYDPRKANLYGKLAQSVYNNTGYRMGGPEEDFSQMIGGPESAADFLMSTAGPAAETMYAWKGGPRKGLQRTAASIESTIPFGTIAQGLFDYPYPHQGGAIPNAAIRAIGAWQDPLPKSGEYYAP